MNTIPRNEHPNPQFERKNYVNLNGEWDFEIDNSESGEARGLIEKDSLLGKITVPFCPESELSGVGNKDFMRCVWYKKKVTMPEGFDKGEVILTVGACDYRTKIWVNGTFCTEHIGGFTPITVAIGSKLKAGENVITVCAYDNTRSGLQPGGKQSTQYGSYGCFYTRTTGIWQTVMLEFVPKAYITSVKYDTLPTGSVTVTAELENAHGMQFGAEISFEGKTVATGTSKVEGKLAYLSFNIDDVKLWDITSPNLYDVKLTLGDDTVYSYFGIRTICYNDHRMYLNGRSIFGRFILDQGYYPDGILTAPTAEALENDIKLSMAYGYNGARLHQKIFEPRFLYYCDKLGYMVWDEHANWGLDISKPESWKGFISEWCEIMKRDRNHPSIIGWCPFNETQQNQDPQIIRDVYNITKLTDPSRLFVDASGWFHVDGVCDMMDCHCYDQDYKELIKKVRYHEGVDYKGEPFTDDLCFVSEFGGIRWDLESEVGTWDSGSWGYGNAPVTAEEFIERYRNLVTCILEDEKICAFCYTQLTDVEQERNGLYTFSRQPKFDAETIRKITAQKAACED